VVCTLLKTGMRIGELCNLDLRDLRLSGGVADAYTLGTRPQLDGRGASLFVASEAARGEVLNGEERSAANKRERATVIPVDEELTAVLTRRLAVRPDAILDAEPLFVSTSRQGDDSLLRSSATSWRPTPGRPGGIAEAAVPRRT
jgi:integrase